jgi:membrane associated rhomboid family serine protease
LNFKRPSRWVGVLIAANVAIHLVFTILRFAAPGAHASLLDILILTPDSVASRPWTLFTMAFLHDPISFLHVFFNMFLLYSLGPWVERNLGPRYFLRLYGLAILSGSLLYVVVQFLAGSPGTPALGASGAVVGVMGAFAFLYPEAELRLMLVAPIKARQLVWLIIGMDMVMLIFQVPVAVPVHLGGLLAAFLYLRRPWSRSWRRMFRVRMQDRLRRLR